MRNKITKQFCIYGHDTFITGRYTDGSCAECRRIQDKKRYVPVPKEKRKHIYDIRGKRFGKLVAREIAFSKDHERHWLCDCDCGNTHVATTGMLNFGHVRSCGCLAKDSNWKKQPLGQAAFNKLLRRYKYMAKNRNLPFKISAEYFKELTSSPCFYCKIPPLMTITKYDKLNGDYVYNGIDRIDSKKGYLIGNVVPCCGICNRAKCGLTYEEFTSWLERLKNNENKN